jgi:hypothetical protein
MKKIIVLSIVFLTANTFAEEFANHSGFEQNNVSAQPASRPTSVINNAVPNSNTDQIAALSAPKKKLNLKQKVQELWSKIQNFDYACLNILKRIESFALGKKKQNSEAIEGAETGEWKHTKRIPATGKAKDIADKLDKAQQAVLQKYEKVD